MVRASRASHHPESPGVAWQGCWLDTFYRIDSATMPGDAAVERKSTRTMRETMPQQDLQLIENFDFWDDTDGNSFPLPNEPSADSINEDFGTSSNGRSSKRSTSLAEHTWPFSHERLQILMIASP